MNMILNTADGSWLFSSTYPINPLGCCRAITTPSSGVWNTAPTKSYQYRISAMTYGSLSPYLIGRPYNMNDWVKYWRGITPYPNAPTDWITLPANSLVSIGGINMDLIYGCSMVTTTVNFPLDVQFTLQLRSLSEPANIVTSTFDLVFRTTSNTDCSFSNQG
jgi:hypothetical protein